MQRPRLGNILMSAAPSQEGAESVTGVHDWESLFVLWEMKLNDILGSQPVFS